MSNKQGQQWQNMKKAVTAAALKYPKCEKSQHDLDALRAVIFHYMSGIFRLGELCRWCAARQPAELTPQERNACTLAAMLHHMDTALSEFCRLK